MTARTKKARPGKRLTVGASVLVAAGTVDASLVAASVRRLETAHRAYVDAQRRVDAAQAALDAARLAAAELRVVQNDAVETLGRSLVGDGYPLKNPFAAFGAPSPSTIARLAVSDGANAIARLVEAVRRRKGVSGRSIHAAQAAPDAARAVAQAVEAVARLRDGGSDARAARDAIGRSWDAALAGLRRKARAAADAGAPHLYATLFPPTRRRRTRASGHAAQARSAGAHARNGR